MRRRPSYQERRPKPIMDAETTFYMGAIMAGVIAALLVQTHPAAALALALAIMISIVVVATWPRKDSRGP